MRNFFENNSLRITHYALLIVASVILLGVTISAEKKIYVVAEVGEVKKTIAAVDATENLPLTIKFIHSVQKTPVVEELFWSGEEFILWRTIYQSHGVGLPFLESDGTLREEDGKFILEMNRAVKNLELRTGKGTKLTVELGRKVFALYKMFPSGTKISFKKMF